MSGVFTQCDVYKRFEQPKRLNAENTQEVIHGQKRI
jgi:hypothetical protein